MAPKRPADELDSRRPSDTSHVLPYPSLSSVPASVPALQQPLPLLTFSYTPAHELEFTDSALRYFVDPPRGARLGHRYEHWVRGPEGPARLDPLLRAWARAREAGPARGMEIGLVTWRGIMTKILIAPYERRDGWDMNIMCIDGTLYFEEYASVEYLKQKKDIPPNQLRQMYYGYAFESFCTSDTPRQQPPARRAQDDGWGGDVNTNVQWCCVAKTKLGDERMIIGGEVDCVRDRYTGSTETFVELKTSLSIRPGNSHDKANFERKLLKFYFQSFLLGVPEIIVGFRAHTGELTTVQSFKTTELPRLVRAQPGAWDPRVCLAWGAAFLAAVRARAAAGPPGGVWRATFTPGAGVKLRLLEEEEVSEVEAGDGEERRGFLPHWHWDLVQPSEPQEASPRPREDDAAGAGVATAAATTSVPFGWKI